MVYENKRKNNTNYEEDIIQPLDFYKQKYIVSKRFRWQKKAHLQNLINEVYFSVLSNENVLKEMLDDEVKRTEKFLKSTMPDIDESLEDE